MKKKYDFCLALELILTAFLVMMGGRRASGEETAARIAPEILRFHVLANSDSAEDQALKLEVKDWMLEEIRAGLEESAGRSGAAAVKKAPGETGAADPAESAGETGAASNLTKDLVCAYITAHRAGLEAGAEAYMRGLGYNYPAQIRLERCRFPEKTYGDMTFPAGDYDAVRVLIGEGAGKNFWCVLYPSLCYLDSTHAVVPDESKELLQTLIPEDDFQSLLAARRPTISFPAGQKPQTPLPQGEQPRLSRPQQEKAPEGRLPKLHVKWKLAELLSGR